MDNPQFPKLTDADAARIAAALTAAACSLMTGRKDSGMSQEQAQVLSRRVFQEQYKFLLGKQWEPLRGREMSRDMDLS